MSNWDFLKDYPVKPEHAAAFESLFGGLGSFVEKAAKAPTVTIETLVKRGEGHVKFAGKLYKFVITPVEITK